MFWHNIENMQIAILPKTCVEYEILLSHVESNQDSPDILPAPLMLLYVSWQLQWYFLNILVMSVSCPISSTRCVESAQKHSSEEKLHGKPQGNQLNQFSEPIIIICALNITAISHLSSGEVLIVHENESKLEFLY